MARKPSPQTLSFPTGVDVGRPFTTPGQACAWLTAAMSVEAPYGANGYDWGTVHAYGPVGAVWEVLPVPSSTYPRLGVVEVTSEADAAEYANRVAQVDPTVAYDDLSECTARRVDDDERGRWASFFIPSPALASLYLAQANRLAGWAARARLDVPTAKRRADSGKRVQAMDAAAAESLNLFLDCVNDWIVCSFIDAQAIGTPVDIVDAPPVPQSRGFVLISK